MLNRISGYPIINIDDQRAQVLVGEDVTDQIKAKTTIPAYQLSNFAHKLIKDIEEGCACVKVLRVSLRTHISTDIKIDINQELLKSHKIKRTVNHNSNK